MSQTTYDKLIGKFLVDNFKLSHLCHDTWRIVHSILLKVMQIALSSVICWILLKTYTYICSDGLKRKLVKWLWQFGCWMCKVPHLDVKPVLEIKVDYLRMHQKRVEDNFYSHQCSYLYHQSIPGLCTISLLPVNTQWDVVFVCQCPRQIVMV